MVFRSPLYLKRVSSTRTDWCVAAELSRGPFFRGRDVAVNPELSNPPIEPQISMLFGVVSSLLLETLATKYITSDFGLQDVAWTMDSQSRRVLLRKQTLNSMMV